MSLMKTQYQSILLAFVPFGHTSGKEGHGQLGFHQYRMVFTARLIVLLSYFSLIQHTDFVKIKSIAELPLIGSTGKIHLFSPLGTSAAQYTGLPQPTSSVSLLCWGAAVCTKALSLSCMSVLGGVMETVPSANCHATCECHTLLALRTPGWISQCQRDSYTLPDKGTRGVSDFIRTTREGPGGRDRQSTRSRPWEATPINFWLLKQDRSPWEMSQHLPLGQSDTLSRSGPEQKSPDSKA